nr:hypothetical protein [Mycobacterium lepromatosis]
MNAKHLLHTLRSQERLCIVYSPMHAALLELVANNVENGGGLRDHLGWTRSCSSTPSGAASVAQRAASIDAG